MPASPPHGSGDQTIQQAAPLNISLPSAILNSSSLVDQLSVPVNATPEDSPRFICDGTSYGFDPNIADCMTAIQYFLPSREQITYAQRGTPARRGDVFPLPLRVMGDKALCYFQPIISNTAQTGHLSLNEMRDAAVTLLRQCGAAKSEGGLAINIGGDGNIALVMSVYKPQVLCRGSFTSDASCRDIIYGMPASSITQVFGPQSDPAASVNIPHVLDSGDNQCVGQIFSASRNSDTDSWFSVWEAATAIFSMCLRHGRAGVARGLGDNNELFLTMTSPRLLSANVSDTGIV
ncbi:MAG: hypothetical protein Q9161_006472 [Pseudevernia consocians]